MAIHMRDVVARRACTISTALCASAQCHHDQLWARMTLRAGLRASCAMPSTRSSAPPRQPCRSSRRRVRSASTAKPLIDMRVPRWLTPKDASPISAETSPTPSEPCPRSGCVRPRQRRVCAQSRFVVARGFPSGSGRRRSRADADESGVAAAGDGGSSWSTC
jgi:hypothetical protein